MMDEVQSKIDPAVEMLTVVDGEVSAREMVSSDGSQRETDREGCVGWDQADFSSDARRVTRDEKAFEFYPAFTRDGEPFFVGRGRRRR